MLVLPLYYCKKYKTKKDKNILMGMNWYRNVNHFLSNEVKHFYHDLVGKQVEGLDKIEKSFYLNMRIFYKNPSSDPSNSIAVIEKFALDGLMAHDVIKEDNVSHHLGSSWEVVEQDKENPRVEIEIIEVKDI